LDLVQVDLTQRVRRLLVLTKLKQTSRFIIQIHIVMNMHR